MGESGWQDSYQYPCSTIPSPKSQKRLIATNNQRMEQPIPRFQTLRKQPI